MARAACPLLSLLPGQPSDTATHARTELDSVSSKNFEALRTGDQEAALMYRQQVSLLAATGRFVANTTHSAPPAQTVEGEIRGQGL